MLITNSSKTCYLSRVLGFCFFWDIMQQHHEKIVNILVAVIIVVNIFSVTLFDWFAILL